MALRKPALDSQTVTPGTESGYPEPYRSRPITSQRPLADPPARNPAGLPPWGLLKTRSGAFFFCPHRA